MILNIVYFLSVAFVICYIGFSVKPSPVYGGLALIVSGGVGCFIILSYGGSFLGLMVFLVYLGGMMVVFGYTTAMATDQYPDSWGSNVIIWSATFMGLLMELLMIYNWVVNDQVEALVQYNSMGEWVVYDSDKGVGFLEVILLGLQLFTVMIVDYYLLEGEHCLLVFLSLL
uniref:NADH-ubiquinone oxidoreductase chain 6 n=1 Tax=Thryonomys swinderianus TaxID=10169 RepID=Q9B6F1_THRSW|nr:NADH dehydrogenase subunit 6 [Thryonomys swinderianus]CAC27810.1 NADH dehydrogenase subunit 6 [Thryonomys swinderianus]